MSLFEQIPGLQYKLSNNSSREEVRRELYKLYGDKSLLNLNEFPKISDPYVSISHTQGCTGWVSCDQPIGFDIERTDRNIKLETLLRISKESELNEAPNPLALWVAKEAAFKSLWRSNSPRLISEIEVQQWECLKSNLFRYKHCNING